MEQWCGHVTGEVALQALNRVQVCPTFFKSPKTKCSLKISLESSNKYVWLVFELNPSRNIRWSIEIDYEHRFIIILEYPDYCFSFLLSLGLNMQKLRVIFKNYT